MIGIPKMLQITALIQMAGMLYGALGADVFLVLMFGVLLAFNTILFMKTRDAMKEMRRIKELR